MKIFNQSQDEIIDEFVDHDHPSDELIELAIKITSVIPKSMERVDFIGFLMDLAITLSASLSTSDEEYEKCVEMAKKLAVSVREED